MMLGASLRNRQLDKLGLINQDSRRVVGSVPDDLIATALPHSALRDGRGVRILNHLRTKDSAEIHGSLTKNQ